MNRVENAQNFERMLVSFSLKDKNFFFDCRSQGISKETFYNDNYRKIWEKLEKCAVEKGISADILVDEFENEDLEQREQRLQRLKEIRDMDLQEDDLDNAIKRVKDARALRALQGVSNEINNSITGGKSSNDIISELMLKIFNIQDTDDNIVEHDTQSALKATGEEIGKRIEGKIEDGVPSGIQTLDKEIRCFYYSLYSIIIGRPGHGKTTLMINCFLNNLKAGYKPVFFSLEMPAIHLIIKMLGIWTKIPVNKIFNPKKLTKEEKNTLRIAMNEMSKHEFYIVDAVSMSVLELGMLLEKYIKLGCKAAYLDYIQLLKLPNGKMPNEAGEFREVSKTVREIIRKVNRRGEMALIVGAQAGRSVEQRPIEERVPQMKDLEWSSSLEQDAAAVIGMMNREKYEGEDCEYPNQLFLGFPKHRYENAINVNLAFIGDIQYITDLAHPSRVENAPERWQKEIEKEEAKKQQEKAKNSEQSEEQSEEVESSQENNFVPEEKEVVESK